MCDAGQAYREATYCVRTSTIMKKINEVSKPSKSKMAAIERLDKLYMKTELQFAQWF